MSSRCGLGLKALLTLALLWPVMVLAASANLLGAHFVPMYGQPALVFDFSAPVEHRIFTLSNPNRIVIDIDNVRLAASLPAGQGVVKDLRSAVHDQSGLRVVLDLNARAIPRSQLQNTASGAQLVINLYTNSPQLARIPVLTVATAVPKTGRDIVVAIDAGHGGMDSGARGAHGLMEKTITLEIARRLAALVAKQPGFKPFLTRDGDYYLTLRQRIDRARAAHADIFISIHCDASRDHYADGATVYALSMHGASSEHARLLAERENDSDLLGGVSLSNKSNMLASVLLDLSQTATIGASLDVGNRVARQLSKLGPMHRDDVQQAAFVVLKSPDIPSILVETDYITNPHEASLLTTSSYQAKVADAVLGGVINYFNQYPPPGTELAMTKAHNQPGVPVAGFGQEATDYSVVSRNKHNR
ncbi:MAG: N-acetylmuramoyl-L-alanine amidase [Gammaproteobacteria bacterium]